MSAAGDTDRLAAHAQRLRALHDGPEPLVLPNAWDAASARVLADAGFPAIATSSAAVAAALGGADHQGTPGDAMLAAVARIAAAVDVPVTADVEGGYGLPADELTRRLLDAGVVGLNLEDSDHGGAGALLDAEAQAERIAAVKAAGRAAGVDLVLNARVDAQIHGLGADESLRRAQRYVAAGADCVYPILLEDEDALAAHVARAGAPVNAMLHPGGPSLERLTALGVRRVSTAAALFRHTLAELSRAATRLRSGADPYAPS